LLRGQALAEPTDLAREFGAAQELPHVGSRNLVMNLDEVAGQLVFDHAGLGLAALDVSLCGAGDHFVRLLWGMGEGTNSRR